MAPTNGDKDGKTTITKVFEETLPSIAFYKAGIEGRIQGFIEERNL